MKAPHLKYNDLEGEGEENICGFPDDAHLASLLHLERDSQQELAEK